MNSTMQSPLLVTAVFFCFTASMFAQQEYAEELSEEIQEVELHKKEIERQLQLTNKRLTFLKSARDLRIQIAGLEEQKNAARDDQNADRVEELVEEISQLEMEADQISRRLDVLQHRERVGELLQDLNADEHRVLRKQVMSLLRLTETADALIVRLTEVYQNGPESAEEPLELELQELEQVFELRPEVLQLKVELLWAEEEGEKEKIDELQYELRALKEELDGREDVRERPGRDVGRTSVTPLHLSEQEMRTAAAHSFEKSIIPLLKSHCFECHSSETSSGELNLQQLVQTRPLVKNLRAWRNVIQQIKVRSMPPADADQPPETDRRTLAGWLTNTIDNFDYATVQQSGHEPARRLTHDEYNNTIRDLVGIDLRPADRFPADMAAASGFDNSANSLFLQPITLERYLGAAEAVADAAYPDKPSTEQQHASWKLLLGNISDLDESGSPEKVIRRFAARAWRRPPVQDEVNSLTTHFENLRREGLSSAASMRNIVQVILVSPGFLIRSEQESPIPDEPFRVSDYELASRLSYFLWASMPDRQLFQLADSGTLHTPTVLTREVTRMLQDTRAQTMGSIFASQWLRFSELDRVQRDQIDNPWATDSLVEAMEQESAMFFNSLLRNNEPLERLVDADYTFVNEELAVHYRIEGVSGSAFQRVSLRESSRRGILGHGSILAVTSFPGRTSPVVRGNWILTELLGTPPPPPPPNVSEFSDGVTENRQLSQRQKLEMHRDSSNCYACHSQMDPLGFALEEFGWFGRQQPAGRGSPIDSSGKLPDGTSFRGLRELSDALVQTRTDDLTTQITRKMLSYALGRQLEYYDEATVQQLVKHMNENGRRLPSLVHGIVHSHTFQMKQTPLKD